MSQSEGGVDRPADEYDREAPPAWAYEVWQNVATPRAQTGKPALSEHAMRESWWNFVAKAKPPAETTELAEKRFAGWLKIEQGSAAKVDPLDEVLAAGSAARRQGVRKATAR